MISRSASILSLVCFVALLVCGCGGQEPESPDALGEYLGSYSLDLEASVTASLPVWKDLLSKGVEKDIADLVASPPVMIKEMRDDHAALEAQGETIVRKSLTRAEVDLTLAKRRAFELTTKIPDLKEGGCSGQWTVEEGVLYLVRDTVDGETLEEKSSVKLAIADGVLTMRWPGLPFAFVLRKG